MSQQNVNTTASESKESSGEKTVSTHLASAGQRLTFLRTLLVIWHRKRRFY